MKYFITGTHAYGPVTKDSDLDIVLVQDDALDLFEFLGRKGVEPYRTKGQEGYKGGSFYFDLMSIKINIVVAANEDDFYIWKKKTERMKTFEPIEDRQQRIDFFNEG